MERMLQGLARPVMRIRHWLGKRVRNPTYLLLYLLLCAAGGVVATALFSITVAEVVVFTALAPGAALTAGLLGAAAGMGELYMQRKAGAAATVIAIQPAERRA